MPIGGFLRTLGRFGTDVTRGLSEASNRLPEAMETRMRLMGQRQEQARARALQAWKLAPGAETWQGLVDSGVIDPHSEVPIEDQIATVEAPEAPLPEEFLPELPTEKLPYQPGLLPELPTEKLPYQPERETLEGIVREEVDRGREIDPGFYIGEDQPKSPGQRLIRPPVDEPPPGQDPRLTQWLAGRKRELERQALEDKRARDQHQWDEEHQRRLREEHERKMWGWKFNADGSGVRHNQDGSYDRVAPRAKLHKIFLEHGFWVDSNGQEHPLSEDLKDAHKRLEDEAGQAVTHVDFQNGWYFTKDGTINQMPDEWQTEHAKRFNEAEDRWKERKDYEFKLRKEESTYEMGVDAAKMNSKRMYDIFKHTSTKVAAGDMTPAEAESYARNQLRDAPGVEGDKYFEAVREYATMSALNVHRQFDAAEKKKLRGVSELQVKADKLLGLLQDPSVRDQVGVIRGRVDDILATLTGEGARSPELIRFTQILSQMKDDIIRERTGAVINKSEIPLYDEMLGDTYRDPAALETRLEQLIETAQETRNIIWRTNLNENFGPEGWTEGGTVKVSGEGFFDRNVKVDIPQYVRKYGRSEVRGNITDDDMDQSLYETTVPQQ